MPNRMHAILVAASLIVAPGAVALAGGKTSDTTHGTNQQTETMPSTGTSTMGTDTGATRTNHSATKSMTEGKTADRGTSSSNAVPPSPPQTKPGTAAGAK